MNIYFTPLKVLPNRRFLGIDQNIDFLELSKARREEIENIVIREKYRNRIIKSKDKPFVQIFEFAESNTFYGKDLPF